MSDEKYKQEARHSWQEIASIAESVPESASYIHGFIDGMKIGNKELEHEIERLNKFCKEFIYGEDNPKYYKTMDEKIAEKEARILELKETRDERNIERAFLIENNCLEERYSEASHYNWLDDKNEELEHKLELEHSRIKNLENQNARMRECLCRIIEFENCENHFMTYTSSVAKKTLEELEGEE